MNIIYPILKCSLIVVIFAFTPSIYSDTLSNDFLKTYLDLSTGTSVRTVYIPPVPAFPSFGGVNQTDKFKLTVSGNATFGEVVKNPLTDIFTYGYQFPPNSNLEYLWKGAFWFGGIVDDDTLVTVGYNREVIADSIYGFFRTSEIKEFFPPNALTDMKASTYYSYENISIIHTRLIDTFTAGLDFINPWYMPNEHKPMNIEVVMKSYSYNLPPFKNITLLDFVITNASDKVIQDGYIGMYIDSDICGSCRSAGGYQGGNKDDMVGSFKEFALGYMIDNNGDPTGNIFDYNSPLDALALRAMNVYPPVTDTNFNWWGFSTYPNIDYGPRLRGTTADPFRKFAPLIYGTPTRDPTKYYLLSHDEWDYDQWQTATRPLLDTLWLVPDSAIAADIADGFDTRFVLSLGPVSLQPGESARSVFALFGAEFIHLYPSNAQNLVNDNYQAYYDNLYFDILHENIYYSNILQNIIINPLNPPVGLAVKQTDTANIFYWDNWVFPDVISYNIYLKEIPFEYRFTDDIARPDIEFDNLPTDVQFFTTEQPYFSLNDLKENTLYAGVVSHNTLNGEGEQSALKVISTFSTQVAEKKPYIFNEFVQHSTDIPTQISWQKPDSLDIAYYKIYKADDSAIAHDRFYPFVYAGETSIPFKPSDCVLYHDSLYCYYEYPCYDTIDDTIYTDPTAQTGNYYWVSAVTTDSIETSYSDFIQVEPQIQPFRDILVILGSTDSEHDYAIHDSLRLYYDLLLRDYTYDIYSWSDTNLYPVSCSTGFCTDWTDLAQYKMIIIEEFPSPKIITDENEQKYKLFTRLLNSDRKIIFFGIPSGDKHITLSTYTEHIEFSTDSYFKKFLGLDSTNFVSWFGSYQVIGVTDSLGGFTAADPLIDDLPSLAVTQDNFVLKPFFNEVFTIENDLPFTSALFPDENARVLYNFRSRYPETSRLEGQPIGIVRELEHTQLFTFGFHLWGINIDDSKQLIEYLVNVDNTEEPPLPVSVQLAQNYPNPFNGTTQIEFELPALQNTKLKIFNILGQEVTTLINNESFQAGIHTVSWDGTNNNGTEVASGIYLYRLETNDASLTKKMMLVK